MKVKRLIELLSLYDPELEVVIVDGYSCRMYAGNFEVESFKDLDGQVTLDIGIGGCEVDYDNEND